MKLLLGQLDALLLSLCQDRCSSWTGAGVGFPLVGPQLLSLVKLQACLPIPLAIPETVP